MLTAPVSSTFYTPRLCGGFHRLQPKNPRPVSTRITYTQTQPVWDWRIYTLTIRSSTGAKPKPITPGIGLAMSVSAELEGLNATRGWNATPGGVYRHRPSDGRRHRGSGRVVRKLRRRLRVYGQVASAGEELLTTVFLGRATVHDRNGQTQSCCLENQRW